MTLTSIFMLSLCLNILFIPQALSLPQKGIFAHRGASLTHPENTISAFREALAQGVQGIELDIWETKDRELVIMHDKTLDRTTNGRGYISHHTLRQIRTLDAGSWKDTKFRSEKVPTLQEALSMMPPTVMLNLHIKDRRVVMKVAEIISKEGRQEQSLIGCDEADIPAVLALDPTLLTMNMTRQRTNRLYIERTLTLGAPYLQFKQDKVSVSSEDIKLAHGNGLKINFCCSDNEERIAEVLTDGVDYVLANDIETALKASDRLGIPRVKHSNPK